MNFIDAVKALKEGKCERIELHGLTLRVIDGIWINGDGYKITIKPKYILSEDWKLVEPIKQYEEVEVVRYLWKHATLDGSIVEKISEIEPFLPPNVLVTKLTGTIKKEIKPKVKMREEIKDVIEVISKDRITKIAPTSKIFLEWEE